MAVTLTGANGLFTVLGKLLYHVKIINDRFGGSSADDFPVELLDWIDEYDGAGVDVQATADGITADWDSFIASKDSYLDLIRAKAEALVIEMVTADNPLIDASISACLDELIRQMEDSDDSVDGNEPTIASLVNGSRRVAITGATQANPVVITSVAHGLVDMDVVTIRSVGGMTEINDRQFVINQTAANTFELIGEDGSGHTAYTSGGYWRGNIGNGHLITSIKNGKGETLENALPEDLVLKINSSAAAGAESGSLGGQVETHSTRMSHLWPANTGSGSSVTITTVKPSDDVIISNGDFESFATANTPDDWTISVGVAGTDIKEDAVDHYAGAKCLEYDGDASTLSTLTQNLTGLSSRTPYGLVVRVKADVVPAAGVLHIDLYDGSNIIADESGTDNDFTITLTAATTEYLPYATVFRLPERVPSTVTLRLRLSTAISSGTSVFIDDLTMFALTETYDGGPYAGLVRGSADMGLDDEFVVTVTNDVRGDFQTYFHRLFGLPEKQLPSDTGGSETINDNLIA